MEILIGIIICIILFSFFEKTIKKFILFLGFALLTIFLCSSNNLSFIINTFLSVIIFKGLKDTLFNLSILFKFLFRSKYKFKERSLGKFVAILFELNFAILIILCYTLLISNAHYILSFDFQSLLVTFIGICILQLIKNLIYKNTYSYYPNRFV